AGSADGLKATIAATASPYGLGLATTVAPPQRPTGSILGRRGGLVFNRREWPSFRSALTRRPCDWAATGASRAATTLLRTARQLRPAPSPSNAATARPSMSATTRQGCFEEAATNDELRPSSAGHKVVSVRLASTERPPTATCDPAWPLDRDRH